MKAHDHAAMAADATHAGHSMQMSQEQEPGVAMLGHHAMMRWVDPVVMGLGAWLVASPPALGYRSAGLIWSDIISGLLVVALGWLSFRARKVWAPWGVVLVGTWLIFAPVIFWAPTAAEYANDTVVGALLIAFAILIPHGMEMPGPQVPAGWSYNPATWGQRAPILVLGLVGFFISRYMAAYQLGHIPEAWDPFFGVGTERILKSEVSRMFPVSDAGLGAAVYLLEVLMTAMGDPRRWRTMPWMVAFFALLVVPLGVTSVVLVVLQPLAVGTWCTLCLVAAVTMLVMVPLALDEVVAMGQFLAQSRRGGKSLWRTFWVGGTIAEGQEATRARDVATGRAGAMFWGLTVPWSLLASVALGGWLMAAPDVVGATGPLADSDRLVGALVATIAMIALAEVARVSRLLNVGCGLWLLAAPWLLGPASLTGTRNDLLVGGAVILLSLPRGPVRERYGSWDRFVR